jgi:hypothetical protein
MHVCVQADMYVGMRHSLTIRYSIMIQYMPRRSKDAAFIATLNSLRQNVSLITVATSGASGRTKDHSEEMILFTVS